MKKYYDEATKSLIDTSKESCSLDVWKTGEANNFKCAKHPNGYYVFIPSEAISNSDEYSEDDPYTVRDNIDSEFHQRRFNATAALINELKGDRKLRVLDLGCGEGHLTEVIRKLNPEHEVFGLDYAISAIDYAVKHFPDIDFIVADGYKPPYEDSFFDVVVCNNIWEHVPDPLSLLTGIKRILKDEGLIIISTPSRYRFGNILRVLTGIGTKFVSKLHVTEYSVGQVQEQLKFGGFDIEKVYSPFIKEKNIFFTILKGIISLFLKLIRSNHILEATVFYAASKTPTKKIF